MAELSIARATPFLHHDTQRPAASLERVINFSTVLARVYARPLTLRDLLNFLDGTKSLSK
jgi:hypothetical protein